MRNLKLASVCLTENEVDCTGEVEAVIENYPGCLLSIMMNNKNLSESIFIRYIFR
jgi:hypothetical protein